MKINTLTFTRFLAAISIVFFHYGKELTFVGSGFFKNIVDQANLGVSYFFILSGFVMVIAYHKKKEINTRSYLRNRFARIYPLYFTAIFLVLAIQFFKNANLYNLILNVLMLQSWVPTKALTLNSPGWSLSVELFFYISFPVLFNYFYSKFKLKWLMLGAILFWAISQVVFVALVTKYIAFNHLSVKDIMYHPIFHINQFIIGNLAGLYFVKKVKHKEQNYLPHLIALVLLLVLVLQLKLNLYLHNGLLAILFVPFIILLSLTKDKITQFFTKRVFVLLGEISYGIYILQFPIWILFSNYRMEKYLGLNRILDANFIFTVKLFVLISCAYISYKLIEKPLRQKLKK